MRPGPAMEERTMSQFELMVIRALRANYQAVADWAIQRYGAHWVEHWA